MTVEEIYNPEKANTDNAKEYDRLCAIYDSGDHSVLTKMAECVIKSTEIRDFIFQIKYGFEYDL